MSKYGIDYYGAAYYGSNSLVTFNASPFTAVPYDYAAIVLTWTTPGGEWDYLRLVRNSYGFPVTADDGDVLFEDAANVSRISFKDNGAIPNNVGLKPGHPYYYSIFVRETVHSTWQVAGNAIGISVKNYNTLELMYNSLPTILTSQVPYDSYLDESNDVLKRFLKLFALNLDLYKSQTENVLNRYKITDINGTLVPIFMKQFGLTYEPELGLKQSRILLNNAIRLYKNKGSKLGLQEYVKAYGGYDNVVTMGKNLMLDQNDSSFEQSVGSWNAVSGCTIARHSTTDSPSITPYNAPGAQANFPNLQKGTLQVTGTASGTATLSLTGDTPIHYGIPVVAGSTYTFSAFAQAGSTSRTIAAQLSWYDYNGNLVSTSSEGTGASDGSGTWTRVVTTKEAPAGSYFCVPTLKVKSTVSSEKHYFDALQFELGSSATYFEEARQIKITLIANRINELLNPNFEETTDNWYATNASLVIEEDEDDGVPEGEYAAAISGGTTEMYASASGTVTLSSSQMAVLAENDYTFSIYVAAQDEPGASYTVTPYIKWYDSDDTLLSTSHGEPVVAGNSFVRPYVTGFAPTDVSYAVVGVTWHATASGNELSLDAALFEKSSFLNSFFDGSNGVAQLTDLFWEGNTPNNGRSHYYINRFAVQSRLVKTIPDWINLGSTFELLLAQPS